MRVPIRCAVAIAAAAALLGCDEPTQPLSPAGASPSSSIASAGGSTIAFMFIEPRCGIGMSTGCDPDGWWGWSTWTSVATIGVDGTNQRSITTAFENLGAAPMDPVWSPDGMRIAYQQGGEVAVVAGGGGTPINLTRHAAGDHQPTFSPDGARIAFSSNRGGSNELYVMNSTDGSGVARLTSGVGFAGRPDWSPDGARIVFDCVVEPGNTDVCAVNADGSAFARLTTAPGTDAGADWSPDGRLAFATDRFGAGLEIATMNANGGGVSRIGAGATGTEPDWSPDGTRIAFTRASSIYVMDADGSNAALVVSSANGPAWRPSDAPFPAIPPPVARLGAPTCLELTCTFDGSGSTDDVGTKSLYYSWAFGDAGFFREGDNVWTATPKHTYAKVGTYAVTLTVKAPATDLTSSATQTVNVTGQPVGAPPVASFIVSCSGLTCTLDGRGSTDDAAVHGYAWKLGDGAGGTASGDVVTTTYASAGTRTVALTVADGAAQTNSTSRTFDAQPLSGDSPPVARLSVSCVELQCSYDGYASTDDNVALSFYVDPGYPGGPTIIRGGSGTIVYGAAGTYTITLTVEDNAGQRNSTSKTVTVAPAPPPDAPPTASFTSSCVRTKCTFDGRASADDKGIVAYSWSLGGTSNATPSGAVVTHDYRRSGTYTVTLTVRDAAGQSNSVTRTVTVVK